MHERLTTDCGKVAGSRGLVDVERAGALGRDALRALVGVFSLHDVILIGYLVVTTICLLFAPPSEAGEGFVARYREVREECLVKSLDTDLNADIGELARLLRTTSGMYDQAARAATSL